MASPVTASITVVGSMSPGLNFMAFPLALAILDRFTALKSGFAGFAACPQGSAQRHPSAQ
jgi:hypothetical protein